MNKLSMFRLLDFFTFGIPALCVAALSGYVSYYNGLSQGSVLMWVVAVAFAAIYFSLLLWRAKFNAQFTQIGLTNVWACLKDGNQTYNPFDIGGELSRTVNLYTPFFNNAGAMIEVEPVFVYFKFGDLPNTTPEVNPTVKKVGLTVASGSVVYVSFFGEGQDIKSTAFAHEIGHVIMGRAWNDWNCERHHTFMKEHNLP